MECASVLGVAPDALSRAAFLDWHSETYPGERGVSTTGFGKLGGWSSLRNTAALAEAAGADISDLDWDDEESDTLPMPARPPGFYVHKTKTEIDEDGETIRQWVGARITAPAGEKIDPLPKGHYVKGVSSYIADGQVRQQWIKTAREDESREERLARLLGEWGGRIEACDPIAPPTAPLEADLLAVYPLGDPHVGMLSWAPETGENFDLAHATALMRAAIDRLVEHTPRAESALLVNLGDFFHSDNQSNRTARSGHALDVDGRWSKVLRVGIEIMIYMVRAALRAHQRVKVVNLIGNHDDHTAQMLSVAMHLHFAANDRVEIEMSPAARVYHRFGSNLLGMTHGDTKAARKSQDLESCMANERREDWGETRHRWFLTGHLHHKIQEETRGMVREVFRTLAARDAWHAREGYIGAQRDMCRVVLHREWGEIGRTIVGADYLGARMREERRRDVA